MDAGSYRASDRDRNDVVDLLQAAYAEGRITAEEHDERTAAALSARTFADLSGLTTDLVPSTPAVPATPTRTDAGSGAVARTGDSGQLSTVMSTVRRDGPWRVRPHNVANNLMGSIKLDLTQATFEAPTVEVNGTTMMGTLFLRVPAGTTIRDETTKVMGSTSIKDVGDPDPTQPTVVLTGTNILGDIKVRGPKKPSRWH